MVVIKKSKIHNKGVFSIEDIQIGVTLECDVLEVPIGKCINDYVFPFIGQRKCIHIGFGSFLNSSNTPNIKHVSIDTINKISYFKVIKFIKKGTELTMKYM